MKKVEQILAALGGEDNVTSIEPCITRLRCQVKDPARIDRVALRDQGVHGVTVLGENVQIIVGPHADLLASELEELTWGAEDSDA